MSWRTLLLSCLGALSGALLFPAEAKAQSCRGAPMEHVFVRGLVDPNLLLDSTAQVPGPGLGVEAGVAMGDEHALVYEFSRTPTALNGSLNYFHAVRYLYGDVASLEGGFCVLMGATAGHAWVKNAEASGLNLRISQFNLPVGAAMSQTWPLAKDALKVGVHGQLNLVSSFRFLTAYSRSQEEDLGGEFLFRLTASVGAYLALGPAFLQLEAFAYLNQLDTRGVAFSVGAFL